MQSYKETALVLSLVIMLTAFGAAALSKKSDTWQSAVCTENLSKLFRMTCEYADENDGMIMPAVIKTFPQWTFWTDMILPYAESPMVFYCPANPHAKRFFVEEKDPLEPLIYDPIAQSYGINYFLAKEGKSIRMKDIENPSSLIAFGDCQMPYLRATKSCWTGDYAPRHDNKSNFIFMDGHTAFMNQENLGLYEAFGDWKQDRNLWKAKLK